MSALRIAMDAYSAFLQLQYHDVERLRAQHIMAELRDFIAELSGRPAQQVQEQFEADAIRARQP